MSALKSHAELSVWNFVDRKVKTLSGNASQVARDWSFLGGQKCRLQCQVLPHVGAVPVSVRNGEWMMFENVSMFSVRPKFYAPLLLLDRLPDCLGQQVVSVSRYGKRSKCYLQTPQSPPHHHYYCLSKHQTWTCTPWDCSVCLLCEVTLYNILILLRIEIGTLNLWMATDCSSFYNGRNHSHSVRMHLFISHELI